MSANATGFSASHSLDFSVFPDIRWISWEHKEETVFESDCPNNDYGVGIRIKIQALILRQRPDDAQAKLSPLGELFLGWNRRVTTFISQWVLEFLFSVPDKIRKWEKIMGEWKTWMYMFRKGPDLALIMVKSVHVPAYLMIFLAPL